MLAFATAYDPSDLPSTSIDPLGFERGYLLLADCLLPGLTNVADRPRYLSILCAGQHLAQVDDGAPPRVKYRARLDAIRKLERLWALANCLASSSEGDRYPSGLRGILRAGEHAGELAKRPEAKTNGDYLLLADQIRYGAIGIYGALADRLGLWERRDLTLSPDLGGRLAEGFLDETKTNAEIRNAVSDPKGTVRVRTLHEWGARAHVAGECTRTERKVLREVVHRDGVRSRMVTLLAQHPAQEFEHELERLERIRGSLGKGEVDRWIASTIRTVSAYEAAYRWLLLAFERVLHYARNAPSGVAPWERIRNDVVVGAATDALPFVAESLRREVAEAEHPKLVAERAKLEDVVNLVVGAVQGRSSTTLLAAVLERHREVQKGKFDQGRPKASWLEQRSDGVALALRGAGGGDGSAESPAETPAHPYRLTPGDRLVAMAGAA